MGYEIDFLPVGNGERSGDAIAARFGNLFGPRNAQTVVVIDAGYTESGEAMVEHIKKYYLTDSVDLVVSTHPDADHAGGLAVVLEKMKVGMLWMHLPWQHCDDIARMFKDDRVTDASIREKLRKALDAARDLEKIAKRRGIPIVEPFAGTADNTGNIVVLGPSQKFYEALLPQFRATPEPKTTPSGWLAMAMEAAKEGKVTESWNIETLTDDGETSAENNSSAILLIQGDSGRYILTTGDGGIPALTAAADYLDARGFDYTQLRFIQVPHHGSQRNVGPTILNRLVGPKLREERTLKSAFVSVGPDGAPKHPAKKVTNAFRRRGAPVHATQGSIKRHSHDAPDRPDFKPSTALPFYTEVEE